MFFDAIDKALLVIPSARAVFLDRDGVINRNVFNPKTGAFEAPHRPSDFVMAPGALPALARLQRAGFRLFVVSNQPDYAKGKAGLDDLAGIHGQLLGNLESAGVAFSAFYYCYHHPGSTVPGYGGACLCRKPQPYFLFKARDEFGIDLQTSWMVGDRVTDIECGKAAGVRTIRVAEDHTAMRLPGETSADFEAADLAAAAAIILKPCAYSL